MDYCQVIFLLKTICFYIMAYKSISQLGRTCLFSRYVLLQTADLIRKEPFRYIWPACDEHCS